ncbi:MAG: hypothetical protein HYR64_01970 [Fimbriimonas ginsengisoli]|uniref:Uncharacterized protein n=1 Tax=Fimbriimonas ginsengisoli TaxID=1005039 RepID=A0A931LQZ4_FIMGI|nr:hypothetical protein [Fimbriimonas ginsengisoli]
MAVVISPIIARGRLVRPTLGVLLTLALATGCGSSRWVGSWEGDRTDLARQGVDPLLIKHLRHFELTVKSTGRWVCQTGPTQNSGQYIDKGESAELWVESRPASIWATLTWNQDGSISLQAKTGEFDPVKMTRSQPK